MPVFLPSDTPSPTDKRNDHPKKDNQSMPRGAIPKRGNMRKTIPASRSQKESSRGNNKSNENLDKSFGKVEIKKVPSKEQIKIATKPSKIPKSQFPYKICDSKCSIDECKVRKGGLYETSDQFRTANKEKFDEAYKDVHNWCRTTNIPQIYLPDDSQPYFCSVYQALGTCPMGVHCPFIHRTIRYSPSMHADISSATLASIKTLSILHCRSISMMMDRLMNLERSHSDILVFLSELAQATGDIDTKLAQLNLNLNLKKKDDI